MRTRRRCLRACAGRTKPPRQVGRSSWPCSPRRRAPAPRSRPAQRAGARRARGCRRSPLESRRETSPAMRHVLNVRTRPAAPQERHYEVGYSDWVGSRVGTGGWVRVRWHRRPHNMRGCRRPELIPTSQLARRGLIPTSPTPNRRWTIPPGIDRPTPTRSGPSPRSVESDAEPPSRSSRVRGRAAGDRGSVADLAGEASAPGQHLARRGVDRDRDDGGRVLGLVVVRRAGSPRRTRRVPRRMARRALRAWLRSPPSSHWPADLGPAPQ